MYMVYVKYMGFTPKFLAKCTRLHKIDVSPSCTHCHLQVETQKHCLWDYIESQLVWKRLLTIFAYYLPPSAFTWGMVVWTSFVRSIFHYNAESMDHGFHTNFISVHVLSLVSFQRLGIRKEVQPL